MESFRPARHHSHKRAHRARHKISNGGPPAVLIGDEEVVTF
jgi:hypothetical protein